MNTTINTGGPAFPTESAHQSGHTTWHHEGMTLRDYFAAAALQSLAHAMQDELVVTLEDRAADTARACYVIADAMMAAREAA